MKVCFIHRAGYPQIGRTSFFEYSQKAALSGMDVSVLCTENNLASYYGKEYSNITIFEAPSDDQNNRVSLRFVRWAAQIISDIKPDVVHCFHFRGAGLIPMLFYKRKQLENLHTRFLLDIRSSHLHSGVKGVAGRWINYLETLPFDAVAFISPEIRDHAIGRFPLPKKVFHFPIGVDWKMFAQESHGFDVDIPDLACDSQIAIYAGILSPLRDLSPILIAASKLVSKDPRFSIIFIGDGPDLQRLKSLAHDLDIRDHVIFLGAVPYNRVATYFHIAHIGISYVPQDPYFDVQPALKTVEYMAGGLATVATNTSAHRDLIKDGVNGIIVEDDPDSLAKGITGLIQSPELIELIGKSAQEAVKKYDWFNIVQGPLSSAYEELST